MRLRYLTTLAVGCVFLIVTSGATAGKLRPTELTLDSSVAVGNGYWVDSGRMITKGCRERAVRLVGVRQEAARLGSTEPPGESLGYKVSAHRLQASRSSDKEE